jgi:hypothetical protein
MTPIGVRSAGNLVEPEKFQLLEDEINIDEINIDDILSCLRRPRNKKNKPLTRVRRRRTILM